MLVYLNGQIMEEEKAKVSILDWGFLYGYGLFETMRSYNGKIFRLKDHLERLAQSLGNLMIEFTFTLLEVEEGIYETLKENGLKDAYIRVTVSKGAGPVGFMYPFSSCANLIIMAREYKPFPDTLYKKGFRAKVSSIRQNPYSPISTMKTTNFLNNILSKIEAREAGFDEGIFLSTDGFITEATTANIFFISEDSLFTPSIDTGILEGITRKVVIQIAHKWGINIKEDRISLSRLGDFEEAFLTNSLIEVMPLVEIEGISIGKGFAGNMTKRILHAYRELIRESSS